MTRAEAIELLKLYKGWNHMQQSRLPEEQAILDARRKMLLKATELLTEDEKTND